MVKFLMVESMFIVNGMFEKNVEDFLNLDFDNDGYCIFVNFVD